METTIVENRMNASAQAVERPTPRDGGDEDDRPLSFILDGSNIAYEGGGPPKASRLQKVIERIHKLGDEDEILCVAIVDARLRHKVVDKDTLESLIQECIILQAPAGTEADDFIIQYARMVEEKGSRPIIVSNDRYIGRDIEGINRISFMCIPFGDEEEIFFEPPLENYLNEDEKDDSAIEEDSESDTEEGPEGIDATVLRGLIRFTLAKFGPDRDGKEFLLSEFADWLYKELGVEFLHEYGYGRPKDLATALEQNGLVELEMSPIGGPVRMRITKMLARFS